MKQVQITPELVAQWKAECAEQLAAGWKVADVRSRLVRNGCTPQLMEQVLRHGKSQALAADRGQGRAMLVGGIVLVVLGIGLVVAQEFLAQWTGASRIAVPAGLIFCGLLASARGLLKSVFG